MYIVIWEYHVKEEKQPEFIEVYSPVGAWAKLFNKSNGYVGTKLLHDEINPQRYLTLDKWVSRKQYETFLSQWETEYKALDVQCEKLTINEYLIGKGDTIET